MAEIKRTYGKPEPVVETIISPIAVRDVQVSQSVRAGDYLTAKITDDGKVRYQPIRPGEAYCAVAFTDADAGAFTRIHAHAGHPLDPNRDPSANQEPGFYRMVSEASGNPPLEQIVVTYRHTIPDPDSTLCSALYDALRNLYGCAVKVHTDQAVGIDLPEGVISRTTTNPPHHPLTSAIASTVSAIIDTHTGRFRHPLMPTPTGDQVAKAKDTMRRNLISLKKQADILLADIDAEGGK